MCTSIPPLARGHSRSINPVREGQTASRDGRVPALVGDAGQPDGHAMSVGERVRRRLDAALNPFLEGMLARSDLPSRNGMGVSMPILPDGTPRVQGGGLLRSQPHPPARHERPGNHSANHKAANDI